VHAHIVLAHPAANSYNAHLANCARRTLEAEGWTTTLSDFYRMDFDPCERASHFSAPLEPTRFDVQAEQRHASAEGTVPPEVAAEIGHLDRADLLILQYPMWWHLPPAMLKGWLDRVLIYGAIYTSKKRFEHGRFAGKRAMLSLTVGTSEETYAFNGRSGHIDLLLWPVNFTLAYVGYSVLTPFVAYGVEAGLRYSAAAAVEARLQRTGEQYASALSALAQRGSVPFNRMAHWGSDDRVVSQAPVYSPFIRHRRDLALA
jgi:NAD(P)H dehydrogenase (quinone)